MRRAIRNQGRELVTERFSAAGGHDHAGVMTVQQTANDFLLQGTKRTVSPVPAEWDQQVRFRGHAGSISDAGTEAC